ncbi:MAG: peptidylprolyl isomerase [Bacteroidales bacterium]|nr:peptidylprolyl isomerase [Bacteroidales bacterium]
MAVIGRIRKHSGLLLVIIGIALASFVLGDFLKPSGSGKRIVNIAEVDGEDIPATEFNQKVEGNLKIRRQNQGDKNLTPQETFGVRQNVYQELVSGIILYEQYNDLGLTVTVEELNDQIRGNDPHEYITQNFRNPETGEFNPQTVNQFLQNFEQLDLETQQRYLLLEKMIKSDREHNKYNNLLSKGYVIPELFAKTDYIEKNRKANYYFVAPKYTTIADSTIALEDDDYNKYYKEHKNEYKQAAAVDIDYVIFQVVASPEDRKSLANEVDKIYKDLADIENLGAFVNAVSDTRYDSSWHKEGTLPARIDSIMFNSSIGTIYGPYLENEAYHIAELVDVQMRPDSMRASHILIAYDGARGAQGITRSKDLAKELADSLTIAAKQARGKFNELAIAFSDDPSASSNSGDLDWFPDGMMLHPFNQAVFEGAIGEIVIAETAFGFHVINITGKMDVEKKVRVALINREIQPSSETFQETYMKASDFAANNNTLESFEQAIIDEGLNKRSSEKLEKMNNNIPGIEHPRQIIYWAFNDKTDIGDVSPVRDMGDSFVVAVLKEKYEEGIASLEQVKDDIEPLVMREKKAEILINQMQEALTEGSDLASLAKRFDTTVDTVDATTFGSYNIPGYGPEQIVIGTIFSMNPGEISKPIKGNQGIFVISLNQFIEADERDDYSMQKNFLIRNITSRISREVYPALEENVEIVDNRISFY